MSKITLTNLVNLQNETTAVNAINANNAILQTAFDNTLSRDGTSPNTMGASLDMNSNQILNLPAPISVDSPARLIDVTTNPTIQVPPVGTSGATVGLLNANKTDSGNNTYSGTTTFTGPLVGIRPALTGNMTWYVNSSIGSDSNNGLTVGTPFQTIQHAITVAAGYDFNTHLVTIQLADGTYNEAVTAVPYIGRGTQGHNPAPMTITGNATTPSNVVWASPNSAACITAVETFNEYSITNLKFQNVNNGPCVYTDQQSWISLTNVVFGVALIHMNVAGITEISGNYSIVGAASYHAIVQNTGKLLYGGGGPLTVTLTGTLPFVQFISCSSLGYLTCPATVTTWNISGATVTGQRYNVFTNGLIDTQGGGSTYFPGSTSGATATGGLYV